MREFAEHIEHATNFFLSTIETVHCRLREEMKTSMSSTYVKSLRMLRYQEIIVVVGIFSIFEAALQDWLKCKDGFKEAEKHLDTLREFELKKRLKHFSLAINVLKHGRGKSYEALLRDAEVLPFRIKHRNEHFFFEGDVSEVPVLVDVDSEFVFGCSKIIQLVSEKLESNSKLLRIGWHQRKD